MVDLSLSIQHSLKKYAALAFQKNQGSTLTYGELDKTSAALAMAIKTEVSSRTPIVVIGHKSHEMLISFLACFRSGHAYVPVDDSLPAARVSQILSLVEPELVLNAGTRSFEHAGVRHW